MLNTFKHEKTISICDNYYEVSFIFIVLIQLSYFPKLGYNSLEDRPHILTIFRSRKICFFVCYQNQWTSTATPASTHFLQLTFMYQIP